MDRWNSLLLVGTVLALVVAAVLGLGTWPCPMAVCQTLENCPTECPITDQWTPVAIVGAAMGATLLGRVLTAELRRRRR
jgi:hypothetical protein